MNVRPIRRFIAAIALPLVVSMIWAPAVHAHCDGMDGPVVEAGRRALESGEVSHALVWVLPDGEAEVRHAFLQAREVRALGEAARELADRHFFETLVRVHRAGEGEPYTGLMPAGRDLGLAIPATDRALDAGTVEELEALLSAALRHGVRGRFHAAHAAREFAAVDVAAGRAYVAEYVRLLHYVEGLERALAGAQGHEAPGASSAGAGDPHAAH